MKRILLAIIVMALAQLACAWSDTTCRVAGEFTDDHGVRRIVCVDQLDGAMLTMPKVQAPGAQSDACIKGSLVYQKANCP